MSLQRTANLGFGGQGLNDRLTGVLAELQGFSITGPVAGATANTAIAIPGMEYNDTIINITNMTDLTAVDLTHVTIADRRSTGTVTLATTTANAEYVTINGKRYTFKDMVVTKSVNLAPFQVPIQITTGSCNVNAAATALAQAIMSGDSTLIASSTGSSGVVTITNRDFGTAGNSVALVVSTATGATRSAATLTGGTATNSISISDDTSSKKLQVYWFNKQ